MINAREEFLEFVDGRLVKCAIVNGANLLHPSVDSELKENHTKEEYKEFLNSICFIYDSGYGSQELGGIIWFENGDWAERGEYDGSEWWEYKRRPNIPERLAKK